MEMVLGIWIRKLNDWGGQKFRIRVVILEECLGLLDSAISDIEDICVRCRSVEKVIIGRTLNTLLDVLNLEVLCLQV